MSRSPRHPSLKLRNGKSSKIALSFKRLPTARQGFLVEWGNMKKKYLLLILLIIIICGLAYWYYEKKPRVSIVSNPIEISESETANWKTYKNHKNGFEIKYPNEWEARESTSGYLVDLNKTEKGVLFQLRVRKPTAENITCTPGLTHYGERILGKETISGNTFCKITEEYKGEIISIFYLKIKDNDAGCDILLMVPYAEPYNYRFSRTVEKDLKFELETLRKMASTFKFTD